MSGINEVNALVLQDRHERSLETEMRAMKTNFRASVPRTIAIPESKVDWIRKYSLDHMLGISRDLVELIEVPEKEVRKWGLRFGDNITFERTVGINKILSVNGYEDSTAVRNRPHISSLEADFPDRRIPIEGVQLDPPTKLYEPDGNLLIRAYTILAPVPAGGRLLIPAPAETGKTTTLKKVYEALLKLKKSGKFDLEVITLVVGERPEDVTQYVKIRDKLGFSQGNAEIYGAPRESTEVYPLAGHCWMALFARNRTYRVCEGTEAGGRLVVFLIDCISRIPMAESYSPDIEMPKNKGYLSQGFSPVALENAKDLISVGNWFGNGRGILHIDTVLRPRIGQRPSAEHLFWEQAGHSMSTCIWGILNIPTTPGIDLENTRTREVHRISTTGQLQERKEVIDGIMWNPSYHKTRGKVPAHLALDALLNYARKHPRYSESKFAKMDQEQLSNERRNK